MYRPYCRFIFNMVFIYFICNSYSLNRNNQAVVVFHEITTFIAHFLSSRYLTVNNQVSLQATLSQQTLHVDYLLLIISQGINKILITT